MRRSRRPFLGLRQTPPDERYDVVVVGAGIGGLICANLLIREGLSVLLVEQHYMMGGYCSTFRRKGFTFDASTHFYPLLGNPTTLTGKLLVDLGIETGWIKMDPVDAFHFPDGSRFDVPSDLDDYRAALDATFPHERENLARFFEQVREAYFLGLLHYFRGRATPRLEEIGPLSIKEVLDRTFDDPKLKLLLTADCPHWGSRPSDVSFVFDSMLRLSYFLGNYYPEQGSQAFADALAGRFEEQGGHIMMSTLAEQITVEDGRVRGVHLSTKRGRRRIPHRVAAGTVVSNADLLHTVDHLLPAGSVDPAYRAALDELKPSFPCFLTHIGVRGVPTDVLERAQGYYWNDWDPDRVGRNGLRCKIFVPTVYEPRMAPPGDQVIILQKVLDQDYDAVTDWKAHKAEIETYCVDHLARVVPGIRERIVIQLGASAQTAKRFTMNRAGAMLGWQMSPDQLGEDRPGVIGPVEGLYLTGHWTQPGGGITPVIISAVEVAQGITGTSRAVENGILGRWRGPDAALRDRASDRDWSTARKRAEVRAS